MPRSSFTVTAPAPLVQPGDLFDHAHEALDWSEGDGDVLELLSRDDVHGPLGWGEAWPARLRTVPRGTVALLRRLRKAGRAMALRGWSALVHRPERSNVYLAVEQALTTAGLLDTVNTPTLTNPEVVDEATGVWHLTNRAVVTPALANRWWDLAQGHPERVVMLAHLAGDGYLDGQWDVLHGWSARRLQHLLDGIRWMATTQFRVRQHAPDTLAMLGRWSEPVRWLALDGHQGSPRHAQNLIDHRPVSRRSPQAGGALTRPRDLAWATLRAARRDRRLRQVCLPPRVLWELMVGTPLPSVVHPPNLDGFKVATYQRLVRALELDGLKPDETAAYVQPLINLVKLFGDEAAVRRFVVAKTGQPWGRAAVHDAGQFALPEQAWTPARWAPLCQRHPGAVEWASSFGELEAQGLFPDSLHRLRTTVVRLGYPSLGAEWTWLLDVCAQHGIRGNRITLHQGFWANAKVKRAEFVPHVRVLGPEIGLPTTWRLERLAAADPLGPMLGDLTGCCQHLAGAGSACAKHGVTSPYSAFFVVFRNDTVVAQSWAWLTEQGDLVLDSLESRERDPAVLSVFFRLFDEALRRLTVGPLGRRRAFVGDTAFGITPRYLTHIATRRGVTVDDLTRHAHPPMDACDYLDGETHHLVQDPDQPNEGPWTGHERHRGRRAPKVSRLPLVAGYRRQTAKSHDESILWTLIDPNETDLLDA